MKTSALGGLFVALSWLSACTADGTDQKKFSAALNVSGTATAEDVGLPNYPGSKLVQESDKSESGANINFATPMFGFKVVAVKMITSDQPESVAKFYRDALSKYGTVLDCSYGVKNKPKSSDEELDCDSDTSTKHELVYKVGTGKNQRIVAVKPHGTGSQFDLVHVDMRGD